MAESLPVLDLSRLEAEPDAFRADLRAAAHEVGFFQLIGHGVPSELTRELLAVSRRFFSLPVEDKLAIENTRSPQFRGYTRIGGERTNGDVDWREQIDISVERPPVQPGDGVPDYWRLEGPNLWPEGLPELRPIVERWQEEVGRVALRLLRAWAESLGAPADAFDHAFASRPFTLLKIVRYPGAPDRGQGVGAHRDGGVLTLLLVEPGKAGLQVEHNDTWIDVVPEPGAFVVNIGEMLELATGGYLRATLHRVVAPPPGTDRISVPFFFNPALDTRMPRIALAPELAAEARGLSLDPTHSPILDVYGENALRYRLRAHPDVAEIHHPDLLQGATTRPEAAPSR
ncbi:MAG TPA: 2-oxoglutarate and iron-dependent oxygenase domain-containing protein [Amnibacterium sp.]|nr:2-oxoglutarate and iron-dependent oxygenase domain-containing protein [Amnibacterium sp.]